MSASEHRQRAAAAARAYMANTLTWEQFMNDFGESEDDLIAEVVDLIEHEPKRGGLFGFGERDWAEYQRNLSQAVVALERSAAQQGAPADGPASRARG